MSALIVGKKKGLRLGVVGDVLLESGFDHIRYKAGESVDELDLTGYGQLDMLILLKDEVNEPDIHRICRRAVRLEIPVVLW